MSGYEDDLSPDQSIALASMKAKLMDKFDEAPCKNMTEKFGGEDNCCLRYLRFYNFNVDAAIEKFLATLQWRIENKVDDALSGGEIIEKIRPHWPGVYNGFTKQGNPIQFFNVGYARPGFLLATFKEEELRQFYIYWMETSLSLQQEGTRMFREKNPKGIVRGTVEIFDLKDLSWSQLHMQGIHLLAKTLTIGTTHYPSNLYKGFITNAGIIFSGAWKVVSPVLHAQTRERITVENSPCTEQLKQYVEEKDLPALFKCVPAPPAT